MTPKKERHIILVKLRQKGLISESDYSEEKRKLEIDVEKEASELSNEIKALSPSDLAFATSNL